MHNPLCAVSWKENSSLMKPLRPISESSCIMISGKRHGCWVFEIIFCVGGCEGGLLCTWLARQVPSGSIIFKRRQTSPQQSAAISRTWAKTIYMDKQHYWWHAKYVLFIQGFCADLEASIKWILKLIYVMFIPINITTQQVLFFKSEDSSFQSDWAGNKPIPSKPWLFLLHIIFEDGILIWQDIHIKHCRAENLKVMFSMQNAVCKVSPSFLLNSDYVSFDNGTYLMRRPALRLPQAHKGRTEGQLHHPSFKPCPCKWDVLLTLAAPWRAIYAIAE